MNKARAVLASMGNWPTCHKVAYDPEVGCTKCKMSKGIRDVARLAMVVACIVIITGIPFAIYHRLASYSNLFFWCGLVINGSNAIQVFADSYYERRQRTRFPYFDVDGRSR